jgi:hypothetical protein
MSFKENSDELAYKTVSSLNCTNYLMNYRNCLNEAEDKQKKLKECAKLMN